MTHSAYRRREPRQERQTVAYVRVSTEEQATAGVSLDAQRARIAAYCAAMDISISNVIEDAGCSAKSLERPGAMRILEGVRAGEIGAVVVLKLDRLTRSVRDLGELLDVFAKQDAALVSVSEHLDTSTAAGRMVVNMLGVVAQWEREAIAERTASALAHKRSQRRVYGPTPFGYRRNGDQLVADDAEQKILARMRRMDHDGASYRAIAADLEARGVRTCSGGTKWHASSVRSVLRSKIAAAQIAAPNTQMQPYH